MNINPKALRYFLYARKSNESEDKQAKSIEDQVAEMQAFAERKNLKIVKVFSESKSAKTPSERPVFTDMISRLYKGEADAILTWKLNRLARNPIEGGQISWMLQERIIQHVQTHSTQHWPHDNVLMMQFEFGMANQYSRDLSAVVKRGQRRKAERGWYPGTRLPIGYLFNRKRQPNGAEAVIIQDPNQFHLIRKVWDKLLNEHLSIRQLKEYGDSLDITGYLGNPLGTSSYWRLVNNPFYCGYFTWKNEFGDSQEYKGQHVPMITEGEFERAQLILKQKRTLHKQKAYTFPFRGCLSCGECGCPITAEHKLQAICTQCKQKFSLKSRDHCPNCQLPYEEMEDPSIIEKTYYRCTKSKGKCSQKYVESSVLTSQILELFDQIKVPPHFVEWALKQLDLLHQEELEEVQQISETLHAKEKTLTRKIERSIMLRAEGEISAQELKQIRETTQAELRKTRVELSRLEDRANDWSVIADRYLEKAGMASEILKNDDPQKIREILTTAASNLTLKGKKLCFSIRMPFLVFREMYDGDHFPKGCFEPENNQEPQGSQVAFYPPCSDMRAQWHNIRTWIIRNFPCD